MSVKLAIGLGNSGAEYSGTRHNAGRIVLAKFAREKGAAFAHNKYCAAEVAKADVRSKELIIAFADGYMNLSGAALKRIMAFFKVKISEVAVAYDDISLEPGRMKLSKGGSSGGHNGVTDIMEKCGNEFVRIRIGIGGKIDKRMDLADHVLGKIPPEDLKAIESVKIGECLDLLLTKGLDAAQNAMNRKDETPKAESKEEPKVASEESGAKPEPKKSFISRLFGGKGI